MAVARFTTAAAALVAAEETGGLGTRRGLEGAEERGLLLLDRVTRLLRCMEGLLSWRGRFAAGGAMGLDRNGMGGCLKINVFLVCVSSPVHQYGYLKDNTQGH